jgi:hypothetical protein
MGRGAGFGYALWAIAQNQLPQRGTREQNLNLAILFKGTVMQKIYVYIQ